MLQISYLTVIFFLQRLYQATWRHSCPAPMPNQPKQKQRSIVMPRNSINASLIVYMSNQSSAGFFLLVLLLATPALAYASRALDLGIALVPTIAGEATRSVREAQPTASLVTVT
jgi:hypothetical protein